MVEPLYNNIAEIFTRILYLHGTSTWYWFISVQSKKKFYSLKSTDNVYRKYYNLK